jgi:hypothetical protein
MHVSMRTLAGLAAIAAVAALVLIPTASARVMGTPAEYTDQVGDAKSAPDVTKVAIDLDAATGLLSFEVDLAGAEQLAADGLVGIALDTDRNGATGDQAGSDYFVIVGAGGVGLLKWNGSDMVPFNHAPLAIGRQPGKVLVVMCSCDIGTQTFDFAVLGVRGNDVDVAPDQGGTFPIPAVAIDITSFVYTPKPFVPKAGKRFTLKPLGIRLGGTNEVVAPDSLSCTAKLGAKTLKGSGTGGCSWLIPKKTRGKKLNVTVEVSYQGQTETFSQTFKIT